MARNTMPLPDDEAKRSRSPSPVLPPPKRTCSEKPQLTPMDPAKFKRLSDLCDKLMNGREGMSDALESAIDAHKIDESLGWKQEPDTVVKCMYFLSVGEIFFEPLTKLPPMTHLTEPQRCSLEATVREWLERWHDVKYRVFAPCVDWRDSGIHVRISAHIVPPHCDSQFNGWASRVGGMIAFRGAFKYTGTINDCQWTPDMDCFEMYSGSLFRRVDALLERATLRQMLSNTLEGCPMARKY